MQETGGNQDVALVMIDAGEIDALPDDGENF